MMRFFLPIVMLVLGLGSGVAAGMFTMSPTPENSEAERDNNEGTANVPGETDAQSVQEGKEGPAKESLEPAGPVEFLNMNNQFIIPLVNDGTVHGIVVATISLEVAEGTIAGVNLLQPKLRDQFLQVLFNHANNGGFDGNFTDFLYLKSLKEELLRNARVIAGNDVSNVLILDLVRQDP